MVDDLQNDDRPEMTLRVPSDGPGFEPSGEGSRFTIIIPCFNEHAAILPTIRRLRRDLKDAGPYELIIVDDGSTDGTTRLLEAQLAADPSLIVLKHVRNRGYGASIKTGLRHASSEYIVITDADGTYPNERIPDLVEQAHDVDMVVGSRTGPNVQYPLLRRIPKVFLRTYVAWITRTEIPDLNSGLRVFRRDIVKRFAFILSDGFSFTTTITLTMLTNGFQVRYLPIDYSARVGKSKIRPIRDTLNFMHLIIRAGVYFAPTRTLFPLTFASFIVFFASLAYDIIILRNLADKTILFFMFGCGLALFSLAADVLSMIIRKIATDVRPGLHAAPRAAGRLVPERADVAARKKSA